MIIIAGIVWESESGALVFVQPVDVGLLLDTACSASSTPGKSGLR